MSDKLYEFIVSYSPSHCLIQAIDIGCDDSKIKHWYKQALDSSRNLNAKYGDVVGWNNHFWYSVRASNAKEALDVFLEKRKNSEG